MSSKVHRPIAGRERTKPYSSVNGGGTNTAAARFGAIRITEKLLNSPNQARTLRKHRPLCEIGCGGSEVRQRNCCQREKAETRSNIGWVEN